MTLSPKEQQVLDSLLIEAVRAADLDHVRLYVSRGADVHVKVDSIRQSYINNGFSYSHDVSGELFTLMCAAGFRQPVADFLLEQGVNVDVPDSNGNTPLMMAVKAGDAGRVGYFLSKGADPMAANKAGRIVLEEARLLNQSYGDRRQQIIDALVAALPQAEARKKAAAEKPAPQEQPSAAPPGIVVPKTASFGQKRPQSGFRL